MRGPLGEEASCPEHVMLNDVPRRVTMWNQVALLCHREDGPAKTPESRGTESVLNALVLATYDARNIT